MASASASEMLVSVVVPVRDEAANVTAVAAQVARALTGRRFEVLFVDDGSVDATVDMLSALAARDERVRILRLGRQSGKAAALAAGFREARGDVIATVDGDLQDDPAEIPAMLDDLGRFDLVSGWKTRRRDPWRRRAASRLFNLAVRRTCGIELHDVNCGLKAYTAACAAAIVEDCVGDMHRFLPVFAHARGFRVGERPVAHRARTNGRSRYGIERYARGFLDLWSALVVARYAQRPMHVLGGAGLVVMGLAAACFAAYPVAALTSDGGLGAVPAIAGALLVLLGSQLLLAGVVTEAIVHRHRWPIAYSTVITLPAATQIGRLHGPLMAVPSPVEAGSRDP